MNPIPISFQVESPSQGRAVLQSSAEQFPGRLETHRDTRGTYLDTFDWRLFKDGGSLISTEDARATILRWNALDGPTRFRLRLDSDPRFAWDLPPGSFRTELESLVEMRRLLPRLAITSRGETLRVLDGNQKTVARLHFHQDSVYSPESTALPLELPALLTAEPVRGYPKEFRALLAYLEREQQLVLTPASQLITALDLLGKDPTAGPSRFEVRLSPEMRSDEATKLLHKALLKSILNNEAGVRQDLDTEFLHDFRVAVRRTRSALTQIKDVYPPPIVEHFKREFAWLGQVTGANRDLDVYLLKMPEYRASLPGQLEPHLEPLQEFLTRHQRLEHSRLVEQLDSERFARLIRGWEAFLVEPLPEVGSPPLAEKPILPTASSRIWKAYCRVLKQGRSIDDDSPAESLHRLRINCKKLRYLLEFFRCLYDEREIGALIKALKRLQDNLGDFNDLEVQQDRLQRFAHDMFQEGLATGETLMAMGRLVDRLETRQAEERHNFQQEFTKFASKKKRARFRALFETQPTVVP